MRYVVESEKSVDEVLEALKEAVPNHKFGILNTLDLKGTLNSKGFDFDNACYILDVCNPGQAVKVLAEDMGMNVALPCRLTVYEEDGTTKIGMVRPQALLSGLSDAPALAKVAAEVEDTMKAIIDDAR